MASDSPARASIKRSASAGDIEGAAAGSAVKRARAAPGPVVVLVVAVSDEFGQRCFKAVVEARDDAGSTALERQCASMRERGVRNALVRLGDGEFEFSMADLDVLEVVKRLRYCDDDEVCEQEVEPLGECAVVRDIPEGYLIRVNTEAHKFDNNQAVTVTDEMLADAHFVCLNLIEMPL